LRVTAIIGLAFSVVISLVVTASMNFACFGSLSDTNASYEPAAALGAERAILRFVVCLCNIINVGRPNQSNSSSGRPDSAVTDRPRHLQWRAGN